MTHPIVSKQRIEDAQQSARNVHRKRLEELSENRRSFEKFHQNLALISGGTVALSVTYLGYLKTITSKPSHLEFLIASWIALLLCLVCATYYSFFNAAYMGYARSREYAQRLKEQHETAVEEIPHVNVVGIETKAELDHYIKELRDTAAARGKDVQWNKRREKFHELLFSACSITSRVLFVVGLALLLFFAIANISVSHVTTP